METHEGTVSGAWRTLVMVFLAGGLLMAHAAPKPTLNSAGSVLIGRQPESQVLWKGSTATLSVLGPPVILEQTTNLSLSAGWDYSLWVSVEGGLPLGIQWSRDGIDIPGATGSSLMLTNVQVGDAGVYAATVTNAYGSARSDDLRITVKDSPPRITQDPGSQTMGVGGSARFTVKARGSAPLTYQWRFNGEDIPGASEEELVLDNLRSGQTGYYSVIVSNAFGLIFSRKAQLSVLQVVAWGEIDYSNPTPNPLISNGVSLAVGSRHVLIRQADGTVACWVYVHSSYSFPGYQTNVPDGLTAVSAIAAGDSHSLALKSNGTVAAWGDNSSHQTNVPVGLSNVVAIAAGSRHNLALKADGTVVTWGSAADPVPAHVSNVVAVAAGGYNNLALRADGSVVAWGDNAFGQTNIPPGLCNVISVAVGQTHGLALKTDGSVVAWGEQTECAGWLVQRSSHNLWRSQQPGLKIGWHLGRLGSFDSRLAVECHGHRPGRSLFGGSAR